MSKPLCKLKKSKQEGHSIDDIPDAKYTCRKCDFVANNKKLLCKSKKRKSDK